MIRDNGEELVNLEGSGFVLEPMYFKWDFSDVEMMELRSSVIERLIRAKELLRNKERCVGWNFKIWDGYRPLKVQQALFDDYWERLAKLHPDWSEEKLQEGVEAFVAYPSDDPASPPPHNTGGAVDLTLVDETGREIDMGTKFDEFCEQAVTDYFGSGPIFENRNLLLSVMTEAGFVNYDGEWWHFEYGTLRWKEKVGAKEVFYGAVERE